MKLKRHIQALVLGIAALSAQSQAISFTLEGNSVIVPSGEQSVKLTVINEHIMRVEKTQQGIAVQELPDYVTVLPPQGIDFTATEQEGQIIVSTGALTASITEDGQVSFSDANGKPLTQEIAGSSTISKEEGSRFQVVQEFVAGDEALYGLGQYQSGIMDWKNAPVRLRQYNQEIVVPFLLSTKGYGIYWHNYSVTDFNRPQNQLDIAAGETISFTPEKSGEYNFFVETINRAHSHVQLKIAGEDTINYTTTWMPPCFSGRKTLTAGESYEISFIDEGAPVSGKVFYNEPGTDKTSFSSNYGDKVDYYLVAGTNPAEVLANYSDLTGKAPMFPKSAFGFWQCRERYATQAELLENAREMRQRDIPYDNIVQDWFYWPEGTKGPEWDKAKYPDPKAMVDELSSLNVNLMVSVWPEVNNAKLAERYGFNGHYLGNTFLDVYNPDTQRGFYKMLSDTMYGIGVKSIWLDGTEPEGMPADTVTTAEGPFGRVANPYSLLVNKGVYEGHRAEFPNDRVFNLTRSAYAGQQRYGACSWSGDVQGTWEQFAEQIPAGLNFTMAGIPYWTTDIGGFFRDSRSMNPTYDSQYTNPEYIELLTRWFQYGTFNPVFRIHGFVSQTEIWRYDEAFEQTARKFIDLRYALMPYIYSQAWKVTSQGAPMFASLPYFYPEDKQCWRIDDQFLLGESILVNPVTNYQARERELYLPEGEWYDYWTQEKISGGRHITAPAPLDSLPLYIKAGSIIPMGPRVSYSTEPTTEPMKICIYPGKDANYTLYMDDNASYDYEKGAYSCINFHYSEADGTLSITKGEGKGFEGEAPSIDMIITRIGSPETVKVQYSGESDVIKLK